MLWERGSIGIPSYVLLNNPNQTRICSNLYNAGLLELGSANYKISVNDEIRNIEKLFNDQAKLEKMSRNLLDKININGKHLLVKKVLQKMY